MGTIYFLAVHRSRGCADFDGHRGAAMMGALLIVLLILLIVWAIFRALGISL